MWPTAAPAVSVLIVLECFTVLAAFNKGLKRSASGTAKYETGTTQRVALAGCQPIRSLKKVISGKGKIITMKCTTVLGPINKSNVIL